MSAGFYHILEFLNWKTANPGQDLDDLEAQSLDSKKHTPRPNIYTCSMSGPKEQNETTQKDQSANENDSDTQTEV